MKVNPYTRDRGARRYRKYNPKKGYPPASLGKHNRVPEAFRCLSLFLPFYDF
jgi:hypothetical protein